VIVRAVDALQDGDVAFALDLLLDALDEPTHTRVNRVQCACGYTAQWPGLLWRHACPLARAA
jgi:hypothetical protein